MTYRDFSLALKDAVGKDDYQWLLEFAEKHREKEIKNAENAFEIERIGKLKAMSTEGYLFRALSDPDFELKLGQSGLAECDAKRIEIIVAKLKFEKAWLDETLV